MILSTLRVEVSIHFREQRFTVGCVNPECDILMLGRRGMKEKSSVWEKESKILLTPFLIKYMGWVTAKSIMLV